MAQYIYIDKDALVAEIKKLQFCTMDEHMNYYSAEEQGEYNALSKLKSFLDTIEVKEVDLEKEYEELVLDDPILDVLIQIQSDIMGMKVAKHFFELGLKVQKGE
jgi:hypothetical protein